MKKMFLILAMLCGCEELTEPPPNDTIEFVADWGWNNTTLMVSVLNKGYTGVDSINIQVFEADTLRFIGDFQNNNDNDYYPIQFNKRFIAKVKAYKTK